MLKEEAWRYLAYCIATGHISERGGCTWRWHIKGKRDGVSTLCYSLAVMMNKELISPELQSEMDKEINDKLDGDAFLAPRTQEGAAHRVNFCLEQAAKAARKRLDEDRTSAAKRELWFKIDEAIANGGYRDDGHWWWDAHEGMNASCLCTTLCYMPSSDVIDEMKEDLHNLVIAAAMHSNLDDLFLPPGTQCGLFVAPRTEQGSYVRRDICRHLAYRLG